MGQERQGDRGVKWDREGSSAESKGDIPSIPQSWVSSAKGSITIFRQESIRGVPQDTGVEQPQVLREAASPWKR